MRRIGRVTVGGLVGVALIVGLTGVASAASSTTTGATGTTGTTNGSPATTIPIIAAPPSTTAPSSSAPSTTAPARSAPAKKAKSKKGPKILTGAEIWTVVSGHHRVNCKRAAKEVPRIQAAVRAASVRMGRWQKATAAVQKSTAGKAKAVAGHDGKRDKFFRSLQKRGDALVKRIDSKCGLK